MKQSFAAKTFASKTFASGNWAGVGTAVAGEFSEKAVHASVLNYIATNFSESSTVEYDEQGIDFEGSVEAVQCDVETFDEQISRRSGLRFIRVRVEAHCWTKLSTNLYRVHEIADALAAVIDQASFNVQDFDESGAVVGAVRFGETAIRDMTREMNAHANFGGHHLLVSVEGMAQES